MAVVMDTIAKLLVLSYSGTSSLLVSLNISKKFLLQGLLLVVVLVHCYWGS